MKANYKNWVPKGMVLALIVSSIVLLAAFWLFGVRGLGVSGIVRTILAVILGAAFLAAALFTLWSIVAYRMFSYENSNGLARKVIDGTSKHIVLPPGGRGLDVGCGSGGLTIACAKLNPQGSMTGVDRWGAEYASYSKELCERNAAAEGVANTEFMPGDAVKLNFPDESFDAVTSNYVYHNIRGVDKQQLLLESLRVLKKGGVFAIHDRMSPIRYGDMRSFAVRLKEQGFERVELIDTTQGLFMTPAQARWLLLGGSTLLVGKK